ncbi:uncharacterized protein LOC121950182 [Plectropomus leopardus]|uniref:uncharacterized protein LOC121950182 n=1 Tax=Plectropomus leopardus TaxID=160734 RepID=UPI001C4AEAB2|nr:uncharacterized protein LOC121950182 [Plectropomus leopardus]
MEQDCVAGLYRSLGMCAGAQFSSEDVSLLYGKVFHVPSNTDEAHVAMRKGQSLTVRGQAWGCVSLSDVLLLVEVKYDVVTHLLFTEMLQEHYTLSIWETLLPWQQCKEEEGLEDLAEEALESGDMLRLAELPGAFRIYRLDRENLKLLCLYISLATLRAQREKKSYGALLAARQSWETWQHVRSPCRAEQAALWLHGDEEEQKRDDVSLSPQQQAVLQLLVLTQEQERKHLVKLANGVSIEDLQEPGCTMPHKEDSHQQAALRSGFIKRLRQIHTGLQIQSPLKQVNHQPKMQAHISSKPAMWYQHELEECSLLLLTHLVELQEVQASALLPALMDTSAHRLQALRAEYESQLQARRYTNLLHLISDGPLTSGTPYPNLTENSSKEQLTAQSCRSGMLYVQNSRGGPAEPSTISREQKEAHAAEWTDKQDVCTGCGAVMEDLPYLEILCVSDAAHQSPAADGAQEEEDVGSYEKQGSLIALAWSKPPEDDTEFEVEAAVRGTDQSQDEQPSDTSCTAGHTQIEETSGETDRDEKSAGHPDTQSAHQHCHTGQLTSEERATADQPQTGDSECDLQPHLSVDSPEIQQRAGDLCSEMPSETVNVEREELEVEMCLTATESELWELRGPDPAHAEDQTYNSQATVDRDPEEREAMERERTMRNLVDMQRKVEQRQQRDRERQLLRVQERLSIIQSRKAEEDLLGLKHTDRLRHLTQDLPQEDKNQQKTVVRERLEQLRRERSYVMQSKRDRNTAGFKELLGPVALHSRETDNEAD